MTEETRKKGAWASMAVAGLLGVGLGAGGIVLLRGGGMSEDRVGEIVHNYLMTNPELLPAAMDELEHKQAASAIGPRRAQFETPYGGAWAGARDADVTLVEFFDYSCGYCRASNATIDRLLAEDPKLRVVWRELPVLGPDSQQAALVSLRAAEQGKFRDFFHAVYAGGRPTADVLARAQAAAGVQPGPVTDAHRQELTRNMELANLVRASGTPTFVVGDRVLNGALPYEQIKQAIADARARASARS
jgi:hypothetical protein